MAAPLMRQIRASAGSGKTWQLTSDYLDYLKAIRENAAPEQYMTRAGQILAITFTNAAANEMRQRVIQKLKEAALARPDGMMNEHAARMWLDIFLDDLSILNIRTIDSLLHQITKASALDLGISPDYEIAFETKEVLEPFIDLLRDEAKQPGPARELLKDACNALLDRESKPAFTPRNRLRDGLNDVLENTMTGKFDGLAGKSDLEDLKKSLVEKLAGLADEFLSVAGETRGHILKDAMKMLQTLRDGRTPQSTYLTKSDVGGLYKKNHNPPSELQDVYEQLCKAAREYLPKIEVLKGALLWLPFMQIAGKVARNFRDNQLEEGVLPQAVIPGLARRVLDPVTVVSDALCRLGTRLRHYLVDEFQDTSNEQWAVLRGLVHEAVSTGGSMIWVGDPKQSIYGFRGGNPQLFEQVAEEPGLRKVVTRVDRRPLNKNRRSLENIVNYNNTVFTPLRDKTTAKNFLAALLSNDTDETVLERGAANIAEVYADVVQTPVSHPHIPYQGYIYAENIPGKTTDEQKKNRLERLCKLIQDDIRPRRPLSDILVLVRSNSLAKSIAASFAEAGIPAITENGLLLNENALLAQTIQFLSFLDTPANDAAFYAFITGNIIAEYPGIAEKMPQIDWAELADLRGGLPLYRIFAKNYPDLWKSIVVPFINRPRLLTPYDIVREWYARFRVLERYPRDVTMLRRFLEVLHIAESQGLASIASFLEYWQEKGDQEKAPMPENMEAVRIMTIHKAKGLQGKVVILPDINYKISVPDHPVAIDLGGIEAAAPLRASMRDYYSNEMVRQALEAINLLYVAMTRAEEELYMFMVAPTDHKANLAKGFSEIFGQAVGQEIYKKGSPPELQCPHGEPPASPASPELPPLEVGWTPMEWLPGLKIYRTHARQAQLTANERGILVHAALEALSFEIPPAEAASLALAYAEKATGFIPDDREDILKRLEWFINIPQAAHWLADGMPEHSLITQKGELLRPDLVVPDPGAPLVIDYKTGSPADSHITQVQGYLETLSQSGQFEGTPTGILVYLDLEKFRIVGTETASALLPELSA